jgi:ppGpp synthetase/RelA/SpoT-type nucleotidyltranferase
MPDWRASPIGLPAVLLPASREQIRKLGWRLASADRPSADDLCLLEELVACHMRALELARPRLDGLAQTVGTAPLHITHRAKTTQTIIEKLRREHGMSLARVQDLAGIRVVAAVTYAQQDGLVAEIVRRFPPDPREARVVDRRASPSHGYRAVHVIVSLDGVSIEIQVRTVMRHIWADLMERLADRLGRQIRYGEPPTPPAGISQDKAEKIVREMMTLSARLTELIVTRPAGQAFPLDEFLNDTRTAFADIMLEEMDL